MTDIHPKAKEREEFRDVFGPLIAKLGGPNELSSLTYGVFVFRNHKGWGATAAEQFEAGFVSATTARNWLSELDGDDATYSSVTVYPDYENGTFILGSVEQFRNGRTVNRVNL